MRDALTYGPKAPQLPYPPPVDVLLPEFAVPGEGEDCLNLNIWSPDLGSAQRPVMVWIPGGMFELHGTGAAPWYDGSRFARDGEVVTSMLQRLADTMHAAWVAFATSGDCGWPEYHPGRRATMRFDVTSAIVDDPRSAERALWEGVRERLHRHACGALARRAASSRRIVVSSSRRCFARAGDGHSSGHRDRLAIVKEERPWPCISGSSSAAWWAPR